MSQNLSVERVSRLVTSIVSDFEEENMVQKDLGVPGRTTAQRYRSFFCKNQPQILI